MRVLLVATGACLFLAVAFYFAAYRPLDSQETTLQAEIVGLEDQGAQLRVQIAQLEEIRDNELLIRADLDRLRSLVPAGDPAQPRFVRQVQQTADASGVAIESLVFGTPDVVEGAPSPADPDTRLTQIPISAVLVGGYFQIVDVFRRLEVDVQRAVLIDSVNILEGSDGFPDLSVAITGRIFALLDVVAAPLPEPIPGTTPPPTATEEAAS